MAKIKTSLKRKESIDIPNIHEIAPEDHIKPAEKPSEGFTPSTPGRRHLQIHLYPLSVRFQKPLS